MPAQAQLDLRGVACRLARSFSGRFGTPAVERTEQMM
jgi:hypothetical protein